jgi:phosphatidylserine decarboxylase
LKEIFNDYNVMLTSKVSLKYLTEEEPHGWLSKKPRSYINYDEYNVDKNKPHWGYRCWNDWFTRPIRPEARPIDPRPNSIVHGADSFPLSFKPGQMGRNPCINAKAQDSFWLKDNRYSISDALGAKKMNLTKLVNDHFVGGTVYQAYLDPWCYHRWHSPVSGTIVKSYKLGGTYFLDNPSFDFGVKTNYVDSQPMLSAVSVRHIFIIKLDDASNRYVAVIEIGMT